MTRYHITVTIHHPDPKKLDYKVYIVKAPDEDTAKTDALNAVKIAQLQHPRKYAGCTCSIQPGDVRIL